jgi:hypothetical protein
METFRVGRAGAVGSPEYYFVRAETVTEARQLVARLVPGAIAATNIALYYCLPDQTYTPPDGTVLGSSGKTWSLT